MTDRGIAALRKALKNPPTPHLDDETLALIVDAELAGEEVESRFSEQIQHVENCERCASAYSELYQMMKEIVGEMNQAAENPAPANPADPPLNPTPIEQAAVIWNRAFAITIKPLQNKYRLTLTAPAFQIGEPREIYDAGDERPLGRRPLPGSSLHLKARLTRQTLLTCRLAVHIQGPKGTDQAGHAIQIRYGEVTETAETNPEGQAYFDNIPITALPNLEITAEIT